MRALVAGGDGFIGRSVVTNLVSEGYVVDVVDNHVTSRPGLELQRIRRHSIDVCDVRPADFPESYDVILHLASVAAPDLFTREPELAIRPNVFGTQRLIDLAERDGARLIFASSSEVYGHSMDEAEAAPLSEASHSVAALLTRRSAYAESKRMGEVLVEASRQRGGDAGSIRLFNVYGPGMDTVNVAYGRVVPNFIRAAREGRALTVSGDGSQTRSFAWIDDVVAGITGLVAHPGRLPPVLNLGSERQISILELAKLVCETAGVDVGVEHIEAVDDEPRYRRPDTSALRALIRWAPEVTLEDGIRRLLDVQVVLA